jgi:hypothetical protein
MSLKSRGSGGKHIMLTTVKGTYRHGHIELIDPPKDVQDETPVVVTFLSPDDISLEAQGINASQAAELRASFTAFADWNSPEMELYDNYDAAKAFEKRMAAALEMDSVKTL